MPKDEPKILFDMLNSALIARHHIENSTEEDFGENQLLQDAVAMRLSAMGEALGENCKAISAATQSKLPSIPFTKIRGFRNVAAHSYGDIDFQRVWGIVKNELPKLTYTLTDYLARTTHFEPINSELSNRPTLELIEQIHRPNSTLRLIIARAVNLNISEAKELENTISLMGKSEIKSPQLRDNTQGKS